MISIPNDSSNKTNCELVNFELESRLEEAIRKNNELQLRLEEAEETLNAIQNGEIDAVVTQGLEDSKIYTLEGADYLYRGLVQEMSEGVLTLTSDGTIFYSNAQFASYIKIPLEQITGHRLADFILPEDMKTFQTIFNAGLEGNGTGEINIKSVDGTIIPTIITIKTMKDFIYAVITDISEHKHHEELKKAQKELEESEIKYRSIINNLQDAYIRSDREGKIIMASPSAARMFKFNSPEEMIDKSVQSFYKNPDDRKFMLEELKNYGKIENNEFEGLRKDGTTFFASQNVQYHYYNQQINGTETSIHDITERKKAEEEILMRRRLLSAINKVFKESLEFETENEVIQKCLEVAENLTESKFGFYGEVTNEHLDICALSAFDSEIDEMARNSQFLKIMELSYDWETFLEEKSQIVNNPISGPD